MTHYMTKADKWEMEQLIYECWALVETRGPKYQEKRKQLTNRYTFFFGIDFAIDVQDEVAQETLEIDLPISGYEIL